MGHSTTAMLDNVAQHRHRAAPIQHGEADETILIPRQRRIHGQIQGMGSPLPEGLRNQRPIERRHFNALIPRQEDNIGSVVPGRFADLLIVDGDPLRDPCELRKLTTVYRGGVAYDPQKLLAQMPKSDVGHS